MTPRPTTKHGKPCWTIDARGEGKGRLFAETKEKVLQKYRSKVLGVDTVEFTDQDRLAKLELADRATLLQAVRFYLAHSKPTGIRKSLGDAIKDCCAQKEKKNRRPAYLSHLRHVLNQFLTFAGDVQCSTINTRHVETFLESGNWAATSRLGMRNRLSAFFSYAVKQGWAPLNPVENVEMETIERQRPPIFTVEQVHRLLDTAHILDPALLRYYALGLFCGIRPEELKRLPVEAVKIDQGIVDIPPHVSKTRDRRIVEIAENARTWLRLSTPRQFAPMTLRRRHRALTDLARIVWSPDVMRHTFASYHIALHQSADKTAHELGHHGSTRMLFRHYKATVTKEDAAAFWKLEPCVLLTVLPAKTGTED